MQNLLIFCCSLLFVKTDLNKTEPSKYGVITGITVTAYEPNREEGQKIVFYKLCQTQGLYMFQNWCTKVFVETTSETVTTIGAADIDVDFDSDGKSDTTLYGCTYRGEKIGQKINTCLYHDERPVWKAR